MVSGGDERAVRLRAELTSVRKELDRLVETRLQGEWSVSTDSRYRHLVTKERYLLELDA
jgi:hypothetical protein